MLLKYRIIKFLKDQYDKDGKPLDIYDLMEGIEISKDKIRDVELILIDLKEDEMIDYQTYTDDMRIIYLKSKLRKYKQIYAKEIKSWIK